MRKKLLPWIVVGIVLLAVLLTPIPTGVCRDGGTRTWTSLTYKIVDWRRISENGIYEKTCIYFGKDRLKTIDELWEMEQESTEVN